jgi:mannonate dehydratase
MQIKNAKVIVCCPSRNFVTLKLETDSGITGLGDATLNGREKAVVEYLEQYCIPALIGRDPRDTEDIWHYFYRGAYWKRGPITMAAISAIDLALWDIKAKALDTPLYNLLGGKSRNGVLVYGHANGRELSEAVEDVGRQIEAGFRAVRVQSGVPELGKIYGVPKTAGAYEPAMKGLPDEERWNTARYLNFVPKLFEATRHAYGDDVHLLHDAHHRLTPIEAARVAKELEPFHLFWLEDVVTAELQEGLRWVRHHSTTPLAIGEVFNSVYDVTTLFTEQLVDFIRMPLSHAGGVTHLQKIAAFAGIYHVRTGFHGATDLSPVTLSAAVHFDTAINNFGIQEYMPHAEAVSEVFKSNVRFENGLLRVDESPGIGVEIDEERAKDFPYEAASLPINRLEDGTLHHW